MALGRCDVADRAVSVLAVVPLHETVALREAGKNLSNYRLLDTTLDVTLEPCAACVGNIMPVSRGWSTEPGTPKQELQVASWIFSPIPN